MSFTDADQYLIFSAIAVKFNKLSDVVLASDVPVLHV